MEEVTDAPISEGVANCHGVADGVGLYIDTVAGCPCFGRVEHLVFPCHFEELALWAVVEIYPLFAAVEGDDGGVALELHIFIRSEVGQSLLRVCIGE